MFRSSLIQALPTLTNWVEARYSSRREAAGSEPGLCIVIAHCGSATRLQAGRATLIQLYGMCALIPSRIRISKMLLWAFKVTGISIQRSWLTKTRTLSLVTVVQEQTSILEHTSPAAKTLILQV